MTARPMMSVKEAAEYLSVSPMTIYRSVKDGTLPHIKIRRNIRIPLDALKTYGEEPLPTMHKVGPTTTGRAIVTKL